MSTLELWMEEIAEQSPKSERLDVRLTAKQKKAVELAAQLLGQSLSAFAIETLIEHAAKVLHEQYVLHVSLRDWDKIQGMIADPPPANAKLKRAMKRHGKRIRSDV